MNYTFNVIGFTVVMHKCYVVAVLSMLKCDNPIEAIRLLRNLHVDGLREAKILADFIKETFDFRSDGTLYVKTTPPEVSLVSVGD